MKKHSLPTILVWIVYGLTAGIVLFLSAMSVSVNMGYRSYMGLIGAAVVLLVLGLICLVVGRRKNATAGHTGRAGGGMTGIVLESLVFIIFLILMVLVRALFSQYRIWWNIADDPIFGMVQITEEQQALPVFAHRGMEAYMHLLRLAVFFLGNKPFAAVVLQFVLLVAAAICMYLGVRRGAGRLPALLVVACIGFGPFMVEETSSLSPLLLILCFYGLAVDAIAAVPEINSGNSEKKLPVIAQTLLAGICIGLCAYLDLAAGCTLLVLLTGMLSFGKKAEEDSAVNGVLLFVLGLVATGIGYAVPYAVRMACGGDAIGAMQEQMALYLPGQWHLPELALESGIQYGDILVLVVLMAVGIFSYWICGRMRVKGMWLFAGWTLLIVQSFDMCSFAEWNVNALLYIICAVLAGISVEDLFCRPEQSVFDDITRRETDTETTAPMAVEAPESAPDMPQVSTAESAPDAPQQGNAPDAVHDSAPAATAETPAPVQYIENPLPLPKKRERKALDYDYEVADDDDFDIP